MLTHLFFSGGNVWGTTYLGVIRYLYTYPQHLQHIKDIGGSSIGSFFATLLALKLDIKDIEEIVYEYSENSDLKLNSSKNIINIINNNGMEPADKYLISLKKLINKHFNKSSISFQELSKLTGINLHINAICVNTSTDTLFNTDNTPDIDIIDAVIASISIPVNNSPKIINGYYYCDPGFVNNIPTIYFQNIPNNQILSIYLSLSRKFDDIPQHSEIDSIAYYLRIIGMLYNQINQSSTLQHIHENSLIIDDSNNLVSIKITNEGIIHDITKNSVDNCIIHGYIKTKNWFDKYYPSS